MPTIAEIRQQYPMYQDIPDGELVRGLHSKYYADMPYAEFLRNIDFSHPVDPTEGMSGGQKFAAGMGKAVYDVGRGIRQIADTAAPTLSGLVSGDNRSTVQQDIDQARELDRPLMKTGAGLAGNITGGAAMFAPTAFIPGANTYTGAALAGGVMGALQPTSGGESRAANAGLGALMGLGGQAVGNAVGRVLRPVASRLSPEQEALAQAASREGIPLTAGQRTGSRPLQITESVMENLPLTSEGQLAGRQAQQRAFTAAALRRAGIAGDVATPEAFVTQRGALGDTLENIAKANKLDFNQGLTDKLAQVAADAAKRGKTASEPVTSMIDNLLAEVGPDGTMAGQNYQAWRQLLRPLSKSGGPDSHYYSDIRKALDSAFNAQMESAGSEAWKGANRQYANLKTLMNAAGGAGEGAALGQITPAQLAASFRQSIGKESVAAGQGDLNELTRVGTAFVRDKLPDSFTAQRQFYRNLLQGSVPGVGVGGAYGVVSNPQDPIKGGIAGAGIGAAAGAGASLMGPRIVQALMNSKVGQKYLTEGAVSLTPAERQALSAALRSLSVGATPMVPASISSMLSNQ